MKGGTPTRRQPCPSSPNKSKPSCSSPPIRTGAGAPLTTNPIPTVPAYRQNLANKSPRMNRQ
jgi:hypothetical protein